MIELAVTVPLAEFALRVDVSIDARIVAVVGASGSGKSTLLEAIAGLRPATGRIVIDGAVLLDERVNLAPEQRRVGWLPQEVALFPHLDVAANIAFGARGRSTEATFSVDVLELGPLLSRMPSTLSGGERQRVGLARALASDPRVLLLDEPLAAIDVAHRGRILPWLLRIRERSNVPILLVTHDLGEAAALASHAIVLSRGSVAASGTVAEAIGAMPDLALDNLLAGEVTASGTLSIGGHTLVVPRRDAVGRAVYALSADEIVLARDRPTAISARNVIDAEVRSIHPREDDAIVELSTLGRAVRAKITVAAVEDLSLREGGRVVLIIKTHALRRVT